MVMNRERRVGLLGKRRVPHSYAVIAELRAWADEVLTESGAPSASVTDVLLALSELVANAMAAAPGEETEVELGVERDHLRLAVRNKSVGPPLKSPEQWGPVSIRSDTGRGLFIVKSLASSVDVDDHDGWTSVICTFATTT